VDNSKALFYFPFYVKDWLASRSVKRMTLAQRGAYLELLCAQWLDGSLPDDKDELRAILAVSEPEFSKVWSRVEPMFPVCSDGQRRNEKLSELREKALEKSEKASASVSKRWAKSEQVEPKNDTNVLRTNYDRNTNDIPVNSQELIVNIQESIVKETEGDKPRARQKKQAVLFTPPTQEQVMEYMQSREWKDPSFWSKQWFEHYRDDDWKVKGGKKMTDWQKAVRTWERPERLKQFSPSAHPEWDL
jgi:uncharacterized protein YdaU (DUF1376 family)